MKPKLELLASPPGTGKTTHCIELFKSQILKSKSGIDSRSFFVLPNREHAERIQNLVLKKGVPGLFNAHILTINDLASRLLGLPQAPRPSEALRVRLLGDILEEPLGFGYFELSKNIPGFHRLLADLVREFKSGLLKIGEFEKRAQSLLKSPAFRSKFKDFTVLIKNYEKRLTALGFAEPEDMIFELMDSRAIVGSADLVVFDGFYRFSRAQEELVRAVTRAAAHTIVTLTVSEEENERPNLFYYPEKTRAFLKRLGFAQKKGAFSTQHRLKNPALAALESRLFLEKAAPSAGPPDGIVIFEAPDTRGEIEMIARQARRLLREEPLYPSDICVILRSVSPYEKTIAAVFERFGLPVHIHERVRLSETQLGAFILRLLRLFASGWRKEDLLYLLKSAYFKGELSEVLVLEAESFARGVSEGREAWLEAAGSLRPALLDFMSLEETLKNAPRAREFIAALRKRVASLPVSKDSPEARAFEEILRQIERLDVASIEELQARLESALFSARPPGKNCVQVYDVVMAIPKEYRVVFIAGLLERRFPLAVAEDPLFKDEERRVLNRKGEVLEERAVRAHGERYFFYMALTRAREKAYFTYPLYDAEGRPSLPSFFVEEVRRAFQAPVRTETRHPADFLAEPEKWEILAEVKAGVALRRDFRSDFLPKKDLEALRAVALHAGPHPHAELTDPKILKELAKNTGPFSATRLEEMAACSFRYFAAQILKLKEPLEARESIEMGLLLHRALETFFKALPEEAKKTGRYLENPERVKKDLAAMLEAAAAHSPLAKAKPYRFQMQLAVMRRAIERFVETETELFQKRGFSPAYFELKFGYGEAPAPDPLSLKAGGKFITLRGQIDRLDISPDGKSAIVADYKLSKRPSVHAKFEKGLELQLPLYLLAARKLLGLEVLGAEHRYLKEPGRQGFYRESVSKILGLSARETSYDDADFENLFSETEKRVAQLVERLWAGHIAVDSKSCEFCKFSAVCRFEPWRLVYAEPEK